MFDHSMGSDLKRQYFITWLLLKQNLVFKIFHVYKNRNKFKTLPVLIIFIARSFNISLYKIQYFLPNFLVRKCQVNKQIARKPTQTVGLRKISLPRNQVKILHFTQCSQNLQMIFKGNDIRSICYYVYFNSRKFKEEVSVHTMLLIR